MKPSLKDIASALNVSKTTVSWVLSGRGDEYKISPAMQEKIIKYAKEINYRPNLLAKSLNSGKTNTIGLVIPYIGDIFYAQMAQEIELEAEKSQYTVTFCSSETDPVQESKMIRMIQMLKAKQVDGLIIAATKNSEKEIGNLINESFPFVLIDRYFPELDTNYVILNNAETSYKLVDKLIGDGRKKIAIITTASHLLTMNERYEGYREALENHHIPILPELYGEVKRDEYETDIVCVLDTIFKAVPDVDGFYFATHYLCMEGLRYFHKRKIDITNKIRLACLHKEPSFEILAPNMYIASQPVREMGQAAVQTLIYELENQDTVKAKKKLVLSSCLNF